MQCIFEVSWEVCNRVGGIYTVIESKAEYAMKYFDDYFFVGPYFAHNLSDFEELAPSADLEEIFSKLNSKGIYCHYGRWIAAKGTAILIDFSGLMNSKNQIKGDLWKDYKIDSLFAGNDFDEPVVWSTAAGMLIEEFSRKFPNKEIIVHVHEWLAGACLLYLKKLNSNIATVFTTHATVLGRAIADSNRPLYHILKTIDPSKEAYNCGVSSKHGMEKATASNCDIFSTVSDITALETEYLLGRKPDILLINGVNFREFPDLEAIPQGHRVNKEAIKEFLMAYFSPYYTVDLENALFYFLSGRYEFHNKGIDVTIESLKKLNEKLKKEKSDKTIVFFFFVPGATSSKNIEILENTAILERIERLVDENNLEIRKKIIYSALAGKFPSENIFEEHFTREMKQLIFSLRKKGLPPVEVYELEDKNHDAILNALQRAGLNNKEEDRVKVIHYGNYLGLGDGLLGLDYYSAIWGCHLGVFPSYYEPFGYTPIESAAHGVPAITTDLSGFGRFALSSMKTNEGVFVLKRENKSFEEVSGELTDYLYWYSNLSKEERIKNKIIAENFSMNFSWSTLISNYLKAYELALRRAYNKI
ncbi:MAG: glycosyltransferase [archaeon]